MMIPLSLEVKNNSRAVLETEEEEGLVINIMLAVYILHMCA